MKTATRGSYLVGHMTSLHLPAPSSFSLRPQLLHLNSKNVIRRAMNQEEPRKCTIGREDRRGHEEITARQRVAVI